jgi:hypothetical protein
MQRSAPKKLVSITSRNRAVELSSTDPPPPTPALFTRAVEATVLGKHLAQCAIDRSVIVDVERSQRDRKLLGRHELLELSCTRQIAHRRDDGVTAAGKRYGGRQSNSSARSGHQRNTHVFLQTLNMPTRQ